MADHRQALDVIREQMNIVIVGHVDHGKSTLVGRLLADTNSIDPAKIEKVRQICERQGKRFEYAFLLDALEIEQEQGITIDAARCFFAGKERDYIIIDAPGHIEFLKNMISGAARAEAAVLLIDAHEGVRENSRRHGYMLSLLGINQIVVAVNKMDMVAYDQQTFVDICDEYRAFLEQLDVHPTEFIPVSALEGDLIVNDHDRMPWYQGPSILASIDAFKKAPAPKERALRFPIQDVYRFNRAGDTRRIISGRITSGTLRVGDEVLFLPSQKTTKIATIEGFAMPTQTTAEAGQSTGVTMTEQIYVSRGDIMCHPDHPPQVSNRIRVNLFWLGRRPLEKGRTYKLKMATFSGLCVVEEIVEVIDASALSDAGHEDRVERHEVAEVILELRRPLAFDLSHELEDTSRFVLVDGYDMAGGGIVRAALEPRTENPAARWIAEVGTINRTLREAKHGHRAMVAVFHNDIDRNGIALASALEESLWAEGRSVYRVQLKPSDLQQAGPGELTLKSISFGVIAALANTGQIVLVTVPWVDDYTHNEVLRLPGMEAIPTVQVRFRGEQGEPIEQEGDDWGLDRRLEPRALHDLIKGRLVDRLG